MSLFHFFVTFSPFCDLQQSKENTLRSVSHPCQALPVFEHWRLIMADWLQWLRRLQLRRRLPPRPVAIMDLDVEASCMSCLL